MRQTVCENIMVPEGQTPLYFRKPSVSFYFHQCTGKQVWSPRVVIVFRLGFVKVVVLAAISAVAIAVVDIADEF